MISKHKYKNLYKKYNALNNIFKIKIQLIAEISSFL